MIKATSPAAKISPMITEAIRARDTNTSALMSKTCDKAFYGFFDDRDPAEKNGDPGCVKKNTFRLQKTDQQREDRRSRENKMLLLVSLRNKSFIDEIIALLLS